MHLKSCQTKQTSQQNVQPCQCTSCSQGDLFLAGSQTFSQWHSRPGPLFHPCGLKVYFSASKGTERAWSVLVWRLPQCSLVLKSRAFTLKSSGCFRAGGQAKAAKMLWESSAGLSERRKWGRRLLVPRLPQKGLGWCCRDLASGGNKV